MGININTEEFKLLGELIEQECGITLQEDKKYLIESRLAPLVLENSCETFTEFYSKVKNTLDTTLKDKIVDAMTTNETLWFRDEGPYRILKEKLYPQYAQEIQTGKRASVRIWSAACSTGQEPYSIVMTAEEYARANPYKGLAGKQVSVLATDISSSALMVAKNARYNVLAMSRGMLEGYQDRYFEQQGAVWCIKDDIKQQIQFQKFNLQQSFMPLGKFDMVFLRNVAIYFSVEFKTALFKKIANILNPGGYLFLGASESLIGYSQDFNLIEENRCLFYQLKDKGSY